MKVQIPFAETKPVHRYFNELVQCRCFPDLLTLGIYPNAKELTESAAAYRAVQNGRWFDLQDRRVVVVAVGDGHTPRTSAMFAFRSNWTCYSVDPLLRVKDYGVKRLCLWPYRVADCPPAPYYEKLVLVAVHSHARLAEAAARFTAAQRIIVAIPCCVPQELDRPPDIEYEDAGIWSPQNKVKIWLDL